MRKLTTIILLAIAVFAFGCVRMSGVPDVMKSHPLGRWPDATDLARMHSIEGHDKRFTISRLGNPKVVSQVDGQEVWEYPWMAAMIVRFSNGVGAASGHRTFRKIASVRETTPLTASPVRGLRRLP